MYYDELIRACNANGVSPSRVLDAMGISRGSLGNWKNGSEPLNETKAKIAAHLGLNMVQWNNGILTAENDTKNLATHEDGIDGKIMAVLAMLTEEQKRLVLLQVVAWLNL